jgi:dephospho-CoA kinase
MDAKDIIDIQIIVESLESPTNRDALTNAGYRVSSTSPRHTTLTIQRCGEADYWCRSRAARERPCRVTVTNQRFALIFRDWLKANPVCRGLSTQRPAGSAGLLSRTMVPDACRAGGPISGWRP